MEIRGATAMQDWIRSWRWGQEYFRHVRPDVIRGLAPLKARAEAIPHPDLRSQALSSLETKQFHCEGGGVFGGPSRDAEGRLLEFLLPYQTLCDYLDTVTDRGPSQDPDNLRLLHQSLVDAVTLSARPADYYALHPHQGDGGYAAFLVTQSREALRTFPGYDAVADHMRRLVSLYVDLQVYKHGPVEERVPKLTRWWEAHCPRDTGLAWWEFAAATGSTLGLFALLNVASHPKPNPARVQEVAALYFPWIGALHILLDYYVDQEEDLAGGDLNFVSYYDSPQEAAMRIRHIYRQCLKGASALPDRAFHQYVTKGLLGFYLSDQKVRKHLTAPTCRLLASGGSVSLGIYLAALVGRSP